MKDKNLFSKFLVLVCILIPNMVKAQVNCRLLGDTLSLNVCDTLNKRSYEGKIKIFYPRTTVSPLSQNIREWICESLGGYYSGDLNNGQAMLQDWLKRWENSCKDQFADYPEHDGSDITLSMACDVDIVPLYETDEFITYGMSEYQYLGGAHGMQQTYGVTFRKSDGRRIGWEMFRQDAAGILREYYKNGLKQYFEVPNDEELSKMLLEPDDASFVPAPTSVPYFCKNGITFIYQQYEIAPYAAGQPTFILPYATVFSFMTPAAQQLVKPLLHK